MSGHNKWSKIKHKKAAGDAEKSKVFGKLSRLIASESKAAGGNVEFPSLKAAIEKAKAVNMPKDNIERAVKKGATDNSAAMESVTYEAYGPGGSAIVIEGLTENRNKTAAEVKHILSKNGYALAAIGAATWAFKKEAGEWLPQTSIPLSDKDGESLFALVEALEDLGEVQGVYTNAE